MMKVTIGQSVPGAELKIILQAIKDTLAPFENRLQGQVNNQHTGEGSNDDVSLQKLTKASVKLLNSSQPSVPRRLHKSPSNR